MHLSHLASAPAGYIWLAITSVSFGQDIQHLENELRANMEQGSQTNRTHCNNIYHISRWSCKLLLSHINGTWQMHSFANVFSSSTLFSLCFHHWNCEIFTFYVQNPLAQTRVHVMCISQHSHMLVKHLLLLLCHNNSIFIYNCYNCTDSVAYVILNISILSTLLDKFFSQLGNYVHFFPVQTGLLRTKSVFQEKPAWVSGFLARNPTGKVCRWRWFLASSRGKGAVRVLAKCQCWPFPDLFPRVWMGRFHIPWHLLWQSTCCCFAATSCCLISHLLGFVQSLHMKASGGSYCFLDTGSFRHFSWASAAC